MTPNPTTVANAIRYREQAGRIDAKLADRNKRRKNGYRGPLTRNDLAAATTRRIRRTGHSR